MSDRNTRSFIAGFGACYLVAGVATGMSAASIPATTPAGVVFAGVMWVPINFLPERIVARMIPSWAFDFTTPKGHPDE